MAMVHQEAPLVMQWCLSCHRDPEPHLRPLDRVADMTWRPEPSAREVGREIRRALDIAPPTNCSGCHR
jgi:hypothetical protein